MTVTDVEHSEGVSSSQITLTGALDNAVEGGVEAYVVPHSGSASRGRDYIVTPLSLQFDGRAEAQVSCTECWLTIVDDDIVEGTETFEIHLQPKRVPEGVTLAGPYTGTIHDNDTATVTIDEASATEGNSITFTVIVDKAVEGGFTLTPNFTDGTAAEGTDYTENTTALDFTGAVGETQTFTVATIEDTDDSSSKTFTVGLTVSNAAGTVTATDTATGTITDAAATPAVTIADAAAIESDQMTFTVTLDKAVSGGFTVTPSFTDGTATEGTDYTANTAALTFAGTRGEAKTFTVATTGDDVAETAETFTVGLAVSGTTETVTATDTATGTIFEDTRAPTLTIEDASAGEGDQMTFTVTLDKALPTVMSVLATFTDGTATGGTDYTANTVELGFAGAKGESQTFTVATTEDADQESDETFTVSLSVDGPPSAVDAVTATDTATGTILDDDTPAVTIGDASAAEGDSITFTVTLDKVASDEFYANLTFTDGTATEGTDYTAYEESLRFAGTAGETQTFTVATTEDTDEEEDETFTVSMSASGVSETVTVRATDTATGTIRDDDTQLGRPDAPTVTVHSSTSLSVSWTAPSGATVTDYNVQYRAGNNGSFTDAGYDGTGTSMTLYGLAQETLYEVQVQASNEGGTGSWSNSGTATTSRFTATLSVWDATIAEVGDTEGGFQIDFNNIPQGPGYAKLCFRIHHLHNRPGRRIPNSAKFGVDFYGDKVTVDNGGRWDGPFFKSSTRSSFWTDNNLGTSATMWVHIKAIDDFIDDDNEEIRMELERVSMGSCRGNAASIQGNPQSIYVQDDDPGYSLAASSEQGGDADITEGNDDDDEATITLTVNKVQDGVAKALAAYTWGVNGQSSGDGVTAAAAGSALSASGTIDIPISDNEGKATIAVTAAADDDGHNETAVFTLTGITFSGGSGADIDDLTSLSDAVNIRVFDAAGSSDPVAVDDRIRVAKGGTATALANGAASVRANDSDSDTPTSQLTVAVENSPQHVTTGGFTLNADGTFSYSHDGSSNHADSFTYTVTDADDQTSNAATVTVSVSTPPVITDPGDKTFARSQAIPAFAIAVSDAEETPEVTLTGLPAGLAYDSDLGQVNGTVRTDAALGDHTVTITADDGVNAAVTEEFTITVTTPVAEVTVADASAAEGDQITFTITLDRAVSGGFTVTPSFDDVTATSGTDYTENTAGLTFAGTAGETGSFTVATTEDADSEADETFVVNLLVSGTTLAVAATDVATGTILDDDAPAVTIEDASAAEGDSLTFTVTLDKAVAGGFTVTPSFTDGTATKGTDYTENTAALSFAGTAGETQTFSVATTEDADAEASETFTVGLTVSGTQATVTATSTATGTILDDDAPAVTIADVSAAEGDSLTFSVILDKAVAGGFTVTPSFTDGTATKGTDYTENTAALSFAGTAGETQTFSVATTEDADAEASETFTVGLTVSGTQATVTATSTATGTILDDDAPAVTIADVSAAEGDSLTFSVILDKAVAGGFTVTPSFTDGTATKGTDYTENTAALSFAGTVGEIQTFTVATTEDTDSEVDETFTVGLTVSGTQATVTATSTATGTILDDEAPAVTIADASAEEGDDITFTVTLDKAVASGFTVTPSFEEVTATNGRDYAENTAALSFAGTAGETQTFTVATVEDTDSEADETFTVGLTVSGTQATVTATSTATGTILDDDTPAVTIADASAAEGDSIIFTVTLDMAVAGGFSVTPGFTDVTATSGTDYTENTTAITFAGTAGETQTFSVATTEDADAEASETFTVSLTVSGTQATVTATSTATGTILDDDAPAVTIADASAAEGDSLTFTVTLDKPVTGGFSVTPGFTDVTATKGTDYTENTAALTFAGTAGETQTFSVATTEDTDAELDETFTVNLVISGTTATVTATSTATGTILDDDTPAVTIADASAAEGDSLTFTVTLDKPVTGGFSVTPGFTDVTATKGTDYTENTAALTFAGTAGETQTFSVATTEDTDAELDETFTVNLVISGTQATVTATSTATGTITNDDGAVPAVTIEDASAPEGDSITFTVTLDKAVSGGLTVTPSFTDETATKGIDYIENTDALTFTGTAGEEQTFSVATNKDEDTDDETFTVSLTVSGTSATVASDTATGTVIADRPGSSPAVVSVADASADEGDSITFTVTLSKGVSGGFSVTPSFTDGTATKGTDYTENTAAITFVGTTGETQTFTVATTEDTEGETDETFTVGLAVSGLSKTDTVTATDTATGTIVDDESPALSIADASASEGDSITFTVTLDKAVAGGLTVAPNFTDGTATKGTDYTENTTALTFAGTAGETQTFTVATTEDTDAELDETFTVGLTVTTAQERVAATDTATGTIVDDDGPAVTIADASASEGDSLTFTVTLSKAVSGGLTVTPSFTDGTARSGTDYTENTTALAFAGTAGETQTFNVATTEDNDSEADETFTVGLAVSGTQETVTATSTATGTILDDEAPAVTIADASAAEGDSLTFTVTLDKAVAGGFTVTPSFTDVTATKGTDYTENTAALTFAGTAGETQTFTVATAEDAGEEDDETFTVGLAVSGTSETVTATSTATGTIRDDDGNTNDNAATVTIADASAEEGDEITFTVTLDNAVGGGFTVTPSFTDGTATSSTDYVENSTPLTFAGTAGETQTFTVATTEDAGEEDDETFTVGLSVAGTSETVTATSTATGTIRDDDGNTNDNAAAVTIADASADEGDAITFTVTLDKAVAGGFAVTPSFTDGTATSGADYTENTAALTFAGTAGEAQTFTVATTDDAVAEADETFIVGLSVSGTSETVTATSTATGTILDGDGGSTGDNGSSATVTVADASADEGDAIIFTVTLDQAVAGGFAVTPSFTDGTATSGADYTENTAALTFAGTAGEAQTFTVATTDDAVAEADETFIVGLSVSGTSETVTATSTATGTILDGDGGSTGDNGSSATVTVADASADEGDAITFTVTLDQAVAGGFAVTPSFTDGTATSGADYTENTAALTFAGTAGETQTFTVATTDDEVVEADETFVVGLSVSGASETVTATSTATGTILDDDGGTTGNATVTIADASADEGDAITFTVTLDQAVAGGFAVTPSFTDGTATSGADYNENTAALTFAGTAGETQTFTVATTDDEVVEVDETFVVGLSVSGASETVTATSTATGTIRNDDGGATVTIADASAAEGNELTFTVTLDKAVGGGFTATPSFTDGTATSGTDFTENTTALTFTGNAGETHALRVSTIEDAVFEGDETFTVGLAVSGSPRGVSVMSTDTGTGTIRNDDGHHVSLSTIPAEVPEGASPTVVTVRATAAATSSSSRTVTVAVGGYGDGATPMAVAADSYDDGEGATSEPTAVGDRTATGGADYLAVSDFPVTIPANATSATATFTLVPMDDLIVERNEAISVTGAGTLMVVTGTSMTLVDNDRHEVTLSASPAEVAEGAAPTLVTVRAAFSNGGTFPVDRTVMVRVGGGTAESGMDYDATPDFAVTIAAGATSGTGTFTLVPADDDIVEGDETIEVSGASVGLAVHDALLTLADDDTAPERAGALELGLAGIGRTIATQAVDAIGARFEAASRLSQAAASDNRFELDPFAAAGILQAAGVDFPRLDARDSVPGGLGASRSGTTGGGAWNHAGLPGGRGVGTGGLLARAFDADESGAGGWTLWATGAGTSFSGHPGDFSVDGRMGAAYLGVDRHLGSNAVLGVAVARNQGGLNAEHDSSWKGDMDARLTTVYPYARWAPNPKLDVWGTLGLGGGDIEIDDGSSSVRTDGRLRMGAMGLRGDVGSLGAVDLAVRADAFTVGMTADEVAGTIKAADGRAQRARLMLDVSTAWALSSSSRLTPSIEVGARADGGDVETGPGMEVGGGLAFGNSRLGLDITARGRWLAVHRDDRFGEWGANMSIRRMPSNPNRGLSISVEPAWSEDASGITALWEGRNLRRGDFGFGLRPENAAEAWQPDRLDMQVSYGTDLLTPFGRMRMMGGGSRHLQVGTALELAGAADGGQLKLELLGEQRARAGGAADYGATLRLAGANLGPGGGLAAPFGEFTHESAGQRLKLGTQLQLAAGDKLRNVLPDFRLEMGGEANRKAHEGTKYGFFLRGSSALGGW